MLVKLFGSNARVKILKIFLMHPENKYYIRQLARDLNLQVNSVRRELNNLEKFGLLFSAIKSKDEEEGEENTGEIKDKKDAKIKKQASRQERKYYQADKNFVLFEEIRGLIAKSQFLYEDDFIEKIKKIGKVKVLILTGIFTGAKKAPVDILVVGTIEKNKFLKTVKELEEELGKEINFTLMSPKEFKYRRDITDVFLYSILESKHIKAIDKFEK